MSDERVYDDDYWESHPFTVIRKKASPRVNSFDAHVMERCEHYRKLKGIPHSTILPFDERYYRLLREKRRKIYNMTLVLLAEGLGISVDKLVEGYYEEET